MTLKIYKTAIEKKGNERDSITAIYKPFTLYKALQIQDNIDRSLGKYVPQLIEPKLIKSKENK